MNSLIDQIRCFLLDMDGTFNLGDQIIPGSLHFIDILREQGKDFYFLTNNSSKHRRLYAEKISRLGLPIPETKVFTSGEATALYLEKAHPNARIYLVSTRALEEEFVLHGFQLTEDDPDLVVLGFDTTITYQKFWKLCDYVRAGLPYIATHPDFNCPTETGFMPDIGAMIAFVKASTGREPDLIVGKPNRMIVDTLANKLNLSISEMAMVGDRLYTDIALGKTSGITTCLVLSGETSQGDLNKSEFQPDYVFENLGTLGDYLLESGKK
jgi:4-nitrophenyl phosphatase